jgi:primosomal protein N' (replication factor Y) (superfamily II helicase)
LFTPIQNLGLIVIDEEHENTYKQSEKAPRYHARDAAIVLAKMKSAKVLMGTATPSIETYHNALSGKYALVELTELYGNIKKADIRFADIKFNVANHMMTGILTSELVSELSVLQEHKHQAIVFQNRKGFVPMLECSICGWVSKCINCDIALTYYKYSNNLRCHYCGYTQGNISKCQACGNQSMSIQGYGTERITEEIQLLIPELRVIRFDQDSTRQKHAFKKLLHEFESGQADVLVGTQIVVKGLDFSNVYMSAVINADHLLNFPDFRSFERTFQLLTQLAGRAGRREERGILLVQTRNPEHDVLQYIKNYDYKGFYNTQITEREQFNYPPFSRLIKITLKNKSFEDLQKGSAMLANLLKKQLGHRVLGPETPFISRINNYHIRNILIKMDLENDKPQAIKKFVLSTFEYMLEEYKFKNFQLIPDVDPN